MNNDIFKRTFCKKCNYLYDPHLENCPKCKEKNDEFVQNRCRNPLFFIDLLKCLLIVGSCLFLFYVLPSIVALIVTSINKDLLNLDEFILGLNLAVYLASFIAIGLILWRYKHYILKSFCDWKNILIGVVAGLLIIGLSELLGYLIFDLGGVPVNSNQVTVESTVKNAPVLSFFVVVLFGPIFEEFVYRVGLMGIGMKFSEKYGKVFAYLISIVIFILIHLSLFGENVNYISEIAAIPQYFVGAFFLCLAYEKGGLSSSIIAHILNNLFGFIMVMVM